MSKQSKEQSDFGPSHFINRELSWLEFNHRVLEEALDSSNPLLERLKFFCIVSSNLDEFFEVRVAGIKQQIESEVVERSIDGLTASETLRAITKRVRRMVDDVQPQVILNLAGILKGGAYNEFYRIHVLGTINLFEAVRQTDNSTRIVLTGSAAEYGNSVEDFAMNSTNRTSRFLLLVLAVSLFGMALSVVAASP